MDEHEVRSLVGSLISAPPSRAAAERLREHTAGHPLYLRALVDELPEAVAELRPRPAAGAALVRRHGARPAGHAHPGARDLAAAAAVAGPRCRADRALAAAGLGGSLEPLDEVLAAGVLVLIPGRLPAEIRFAHPLTRAAIYDDLSPSGRRALHLALAGLTDGPESLAHQVAASHGADDELAASWPTPAPTRCWAAG